MKYSKKDFTLVPSRQARIGMPANQQVVYMWLCEHSDDNMQSFPSRKVLAYECGMSIRTLDRSIELLISNGYVAKSARYSGNKQSSNLYDVAIVTVGDKSAPIKPKKAVRGVKSAPIGVSNLHGGGDKNDTQNYTQLTQPIINQTITNVIEPTAQVFGKPEINDMFEYWKQTTGIGIESNVKRNRNACSLLIKRHGVQDLRRVIDGVALSHVDKYAPRISDFASLQAKWSELMLWGKKQNLSEKRTIKI